MSKVMKIFLSAVIMVSILAAVAAADFTVKTKTEMSGMMGMSSTTNTTYLIKPGQVAFLTDMSGGMMGQQTGMKNKVIVRNEGKEMVVINYNDKTYSVVDMAEAEKKMGKEIKEAMDSLKEMMTLNEFDFGMTGNTKEIQGMKASEVKMIMDMAMAINMQGPEPIPAKMKMSGSQWMTQDFKDADTYKKFAEAMAESMMGGGQTGIAAMKPFLEALGVSEAKMAEAMKLAGYVLLEGQIDISMNMEMPGMAKDMPGMSMNMKMVTTLEETSNAEIPAAEFDVPEGFTETEEVSLPSGGMGFPGMAQ